MYLLCKHEFPMMTIIIDCLLSSIGYHATNELNTLSTLFVGSSNSCTYENLLQQDLKF